MTVVGKDTSVSKKHLVKNRSGQPDDFEAYDPERLYQDEASGNILNEAKMNVDQNLKSSKSVNNIVNNTSHQHHHHNLNLSDSNENNRRKSRGTDKKVNFVVEIMKFNHFLFFKEIFIYGLFNNFLRFNPSSI